MNTSAGCVQKTHKNRSDTARVQTPQNTFDGCALLHHRHHTILNREGGGRRANMDVPYHLIKGTLVQPSELSMIGSGNLHRSSREASTQEIPVRIRAPAYPYQHPSQTAVIIKIRASKIPQEIPVRIRAPAYRSRMTIPQNSPQSTLSRDPCVQFLPLIRSIGRI